MQRPMQRMPDPMTVGSGPMGESPHLANLRSQQSGNRMQQNLGTEWVQANAAAKQGMIAQQSAMNTEGHRLSGAFLEAAQNQIDSPNKLDPRLAAAMAGTKSRAMANLGLAPDPRAVLGRSATNEFEVLAGA